MRLPGFDGLRVPARFWMMALACLSALAAIAINRLTGRARRIVVVLAAVGVMLDGWPRFIVLAAPEFRPTPPAAVARLDLPMTDDRDAVAVFEQTFDALPLYNGFSGYGAPHQYAMREMLDHDDPRILQIMTARGPLGVVIDHASDPAGAFRRYVMSYPGAVAVETHPTWSSYRLPAGEGGPQVPDESGRAIPIKALRVFPSQPHAVRAMDRDLTTRWSGGVQQSAADVMIELDHPTNVRQVVLDLGGFMTDFPMRLRIDVSADEARWDTAFFGDTVLQAYYGAVRHPREIPLVFPINRPRVRFIHLVQLGWGTHDWSIAEIKVLQ
jgi:hypothetical protein